MIMDTLFSSAQRERSLKHAPLAVRMRPESLDDYVGQDKAVGPGSWLRRAIEHDVLSSVILYGPAGTGKTTLAHIIAKNTRSEFVEVSAVTGSVKDLRREIEEAKHRLLTYDRRTILFIDEIHRFSRSQQDALLHAVEDRTVVMIGATTENPYFEVNGALLSRSRIFELKPLEKDDIKELIHRAVTDTERGMGTYRVKLDEDAYIIMPKGAQFSDASYKKTESAKGKKKVARLAYTYAGHEVGSVDIVKTGAKVKDNYYVNTDSGQKKNERVIRIDPAWLIVAGVVIVAAVVLLFLAKRAYDNFYVIRHQRKTKKNDKMRFREKKRKKYNRRKDRFF